MEPPPPSASQPHPDAPPSGWKVYGVLFALFALACLTCCVLGIGYAYFLHIKSHR